MKKVFCLKKICIINQKGGVGKTTVTVNLAAGLARAGKKVLLIDLDPQGNLATCLPIHEEKKNMYHILVENANPLECIHRVAINLDLIASDEQLTKTEILLASEPAREYVLSKKLKSIKKYDYVFVDCPPSLGLLNQNALLYCQEAYIPVSTDTLGIDALQKMEKAIEVLNDVFSHELSIGKIIPTLYDKRNKICRVSLAELQNMSYEKVTNPIRMNSKIKECVKKQKSIFSYAPSSLGAQDFKELVKNILYESDNFEADATLSVDIKEGKKAVSSKS